MVGYPYLAAFGGSSKPMRTEKAVIKARHSRATALRPTAAKQPMRERILIVCEGAKTEPHYFEEIRLFSRNSSATIEIYGKECGSAPLSVVQFAQQRWQESGKDFDQIFCVFDRDRHESFDQALARLHSLSKHGFKAIYSYPSFEYWLLLHFGYTRKCFVAQGYRSAGDILEKELSNHFVATFGCPYKKGMTDVFARLQSRLAGACTAAKQALIDADNTKEPNPSTHVHELVTVLLPPHNITPTTLKPAASKAS